MVNLALFDFHQESTIRRGAEDRHLVNSHDILPKVSKIGNLRENRKEMGSPMLADYLYHRIASNGDNPAAAPGEANRWMVGLREEIFSGQSYRFSQNQPSNSFPERRVRDGLKRMVIFPAITKCSFT